jgi:two-component system chemotaxis sensor kinase CheA
MNLFEELIIERGRLEGLSKKLKDSDLNESVERLVRTSGHLRDVILNLRMVPVETVFNRFPRMVRSVAKDLNKQINLIITGQETELDRTVIDEIGDPLVHLLRNSMDHGIERPEVRRSQQKPEEGSIHLRAYHQGNHVYIEIEDDGGGINRDNVVKKAIENGLITEEEADRMGDQEVYSLIFSSGFSTAEKISDLSGRGVGLDVVKSKIEALGGHVEVTSTPGKGSLFSIQLPLTLSIISAMLVDVGEETYAVPLSSILETQRMDEVEILSMHQMEVMMYRERVIPLVRLQKTLNTPSHQEKASKIPVLIIKQGSQLVGLTVDRLIGQQEIVVKPLSPYLKNIRGFNGATILGDGNVSLILDPSVYVSAQ